MFFFCCWGRVWANSEVFGHTGYVFDEWDGLFFSMWVTFFLTLEVFFVVCACFFAKYQRFFLFAVHVWETNGNLDLYGISYNSISSYTRSSKRNNMRGGVETEHTWMCWVPVTYSGIKYGALVLPELSWRWPCWQGRHFEVSSHHLRTHTREKLESFTVCTTFHYLDACYFFQHYAFQHFILLSGSVLYDTDCSSGGTFKSQVPTWALIPGLGVTGHRVKQRTDQAFMRVLVSHNEVLQCPETVDLHSLCGLLTDKLVMNYL